MKFVNRLLILLLVAAMLLCGCTNAPVETAPTASATQAPTSEPTEPPATKAPTSEPTEPPATEAPTSEQPATGVTYQYDFTSEDFFQNADWADSVPRVSTIGADGNTLYHIRTGGGFSSHQGSCCDGEYVYIIMENKSYIADDGIGRAVVIVKIDMATWEVVEQSEPMRLNHGNSMCYNPKLDQILVVHYYDYPNDVSFVDPDTLEVVDRKTLDFPVGSIAYNESRDQYVIGMVGNSAPFAVLDADFNQLAYYDGHQLGLGTQDVDCDDDHIYVGNSGNPTVVKIYNWDGEYQGIFQTAPLGELESMFNHDGRYYITTTSGAGARIYQADYDFSLIED